MTLNPFTHFARVAMRILSWGVFALTIAAAYGGHIPPQIWSLPSVLTLALPYLAILTLLLGIFWVLMRKFITAGVAAAVLVVCWGPISIVCPMGHAREAAAGEKTFTVLTYNVLHGFDNELEDATSCRSLQYVAASGADIVCLQEFRAFDSGDATLLTAATRDSLLAAYPYRAVDATHALTLLSRYPMRRDRSLSSHSEDAAFDAYTVRIDGRKLVIFNVHLTSFSLSDQERTLLSSIGGVRSARRSLEEFRSTVVSKLRSAFPERAALATMLRTMVERADADAVIVCGDFNDVPASWAYRHVRGDDLRDAFTETNFGPMPTYNAHLFYFHIDQILYGGDLRALSVERGNLKSSDHYPLMATFAFTQEKTIIQTNNNSL